jgi:hypothetical protein
MPHRVRTGARVRCATVLVLAALMLVPTAVAAATPSTAKATIEGAGGTEAAEVGLPDDPVQADLGRTLGSLDARIEAKQAEAAVAARRGGPRPRRRMPKRPKRPPLTRPRSSRRRRSGWPRRWRRLRPSATPIDRPR